MYTTQFGFWLLDAVDTQTNNIILIFVVWAECVSATILYRYRDVVGQVGWPAFLVHNGGYMLGKIIGLAIAHTVSPGGGAGAGFGIYIVGVLVSLFIAKTPDSKPPSFFGRNVWLSKFWWMGAYSVCAPRSQLHACMAGRANHFLGQSTRSGPQRHRRAARDGELEHPVDLGGMSSCQSLMGGSREDR